VSQSTGLSPARAPLEQEKFRKINHLRQEAYFKLKSQEFHEYGIDLLSEKWQK
jgi:hypothetical protein